MEYFGYIIMLGLALSQIESYLKLLIFIKEDSA